MNAQIYSFDPACQTECDGNQKKIGKGEEWKGGRRIQDTGERRKKTGPGALIGKQ
jgi:hypothetical protein